MVFFLEGSFDPLAVEPGFLIWSAVTFAILLIILKKIGWGPLIKTIEEREDKIRDDIESAEKARAEAEAAMKDYQAKLDDAAAEAKRLLEEARDTAEKAKQSILDEAKSQADSLKAQAEKDIAVARDKAVSELKAQVVDIAMTISSKVMEKAVDEGEHKKLADVVLAKAGDLT